MSLDRVKTTVLEEAKTRAAKKLAEATLETDRLLAEGKAADERAASEAIRDARLRFERETARELERIQHENRLHILSAKNQAIDEVFKRVKDKLANIQSEEGFSLIAEWLTSLPAEVGGVLRVNPKDQQKFVSNLDILNRNRSGKGVFTKVETDPRISGGAVVDGPDYNIDCTLDRRLDELRETSAGDVARVLFGA